MRNAKNPAPAPSVPPAIARTSPCGDPMRTLFFDRVGRYFYDPASDPMVEGVCSLCGAGTTGYLNTSTKSPDCAPRRSLTKERRRALAGSPLSIRSPLDPKSVKNKMASVGGIALIEVETRRAYVAANVIPISELPPGMTAVPVQPGGTNVFMSEFLAAPPKPPFLLVIWTQKAAVPLVLTETLSRVFVCGKDNPVVVDMVAVRTFVEVVERMGGDAFKTACGLRAAYAKARTDDEVADVRDRLRDLNRPDVTPATLETFPIPNSPEYEYALRAVGLWGADPDETSGNTAQSAEAA